MKNLIECMMSSQQSTQSIVINEPVISIDVKSSQVTSSNTGLSCLGVTIVKESKLLKLQENQPILLSNSSSESDSLLNEIVANVQQKCKLVDDVFPGIFTCFHLIIYFPFRGICCQILSKFEVFEEE